MGFVQSEGGDIATGVTVIPSLGTEKAILLSFKNPLTTLNIDGQLTGTIATLSGNIAEWKSLINIQGTLGTGSSALRLNSTLSGEYKGKIIDFSWTWAHSPSNAILNYKLSFSEGVDTL